MQPSLALSRGTLFVGLHAKTARIACFDLGGRPTGPVFSFRDRVAGRSSASGLAVDEDHTILVADTPADRVRRFTLFGREVGGLGTASPPGTHPGPHVLPGLLRHPVDVVVQGNHDHGWIAVACGGVQRHALQLFDPEFRHLASLPSMGEPGRPFQGLERIATHGELLFAAEAGSRQVQVFRSGAFHFAFQLTDRLGRRLEPSALAPTEDGRLVVGCRSPRSQLLLVDASGRPIRELAGEGDGEGSVRDPGDAVFVAGEDERHGQVFVIDRDGLRVQVFTLDARCLGAFSLDSSLPGAEPRVRRRKKGGR